MSWKANIIYSNIIELFDETLKKFNTTRNIIGRINMIKKLNIANNFKAFSVVLKTKPHI